MSDYNAEMNRRGTQLKASLNTSASMSKKSSMGKNGKKKSKDNGDCLIF